MGGSIKILNVLKSSFSIYKKHFFILISLSTSQSLIKYIKFLASQSYDRSFLAELLFLVLDIWISIAFVIVVSKLYKNKSFDFYEVFTWVRKKFWIYLGVSMLVGIVILLASIPNITVLFLVKNPILKLLLTILFTPLPIYFYAIYNFAPILAVLKGYDNNVEEVDGYLETSNCLVKQNLLVVIILVSISYFINIPDIIKSIEAYKLRDIATLENIVSLQFILKNILLMPLVNIINITLYYLLSNKRNDNLIEE